MFSFAVYNLKPVILFFSFWVLVCDTKDITTRFFTNLQCLSLWTNKITSNTCIRQNANTTDEVAHLKLNWLSNCPLTISRIERSLERRVKILTNIESQVQSLHKNTNEIKDEIARLSHEQVKLSSHRFIWKSRNHTFIIL